jgi:hypothetical protein
MPEDRMPNLAVQLRVLDRVIDNLVGQSDPRGTLMKNNLQFAALGALGPDLLRYQPISPKLSDALAGLMLSTTPPQITSLSFDLLQELFLNPVGAAYALLFRVIVVPDWPVLSGLKRLLDRLDAIAQAENAAAALEALPDILNARNQTSGLSVPPNFVSIIGQLIALPPWMEQTASFPLPPADTRANRASEFLRWHRSGAFARNLLQGASTDQQRAYALGWLCHVATAVASEPFMNNIVGGLYRTHWWRHRLVSNFVDSWTFGFFETGATMSGDEPTPPYAWWKPLCSANLQDRINVGGLPDPSGDDVALAVRCMATGNLGGLPGHFPSDLADLLAQTVIETYGTGALPIADLSADAFRQAFVGAFAVYWFMTSGSGPMCNNPLGAPIINCLEPPSWVTSTGIGIISSLPVHWGGIIVALLFTILAVVLSLFGGLPAGLAALAAVLNLPVIDWDEVRCGLYWLRKQMVDGEDALRDALVKAGLAYPPPVKLGTIDPSGRAIPAADQTESTFIALCRTNALSDVYPRQLDPRAVDPTAMPPTPLPPDLNFWKYPDVAAEDPETQNLILPNLYPNFIVAGAGLQNGGMLQDAAYPSRNQFFGDAVANALDLITKEGAGLPDYSLDADRGYGWKGWHPKSGTMPANPPVADEQDN